jgi:tetratricopeptide (TPR) repeat protein
MGGLKLVDAPRPELYDLAADAGEASDLAAARPDAVARLRDALRALRSRERAPAAAALDPAAAERLRALGYASAGSQAEEPVDTGRPDPKDKLSVYLAFEDAAVADVRGDHAGAVAGLRRLVAQEPANPLFRRSLVAALRRGDRPAEAAAALGVPGLERGDALAWHERAMALAAAGRARDAEESARTAVRLDPALPEAHNHLGVLLAGDRPAEALAHFQAARGLDPNDAEAWNNSANALRALGRPEVARETYERAARLAPRDPDPLNGLGTLAVEAGRPREAVELFRRALALAPEMAEARLNLAIGLVQTGSIPEALTELDRLLNGSSPPEIAVRARRLRAELAR